jgi:hypothetical protein
MEIKETIEKGRKAKLLKDNPTAKAVAEVVAHGIVEPIVSKIHEKHEKIEVELSNLKKDLEEIELTPGEKGESIKGDKGDPGIGLIGPAGKDGYTPIKNVDYFDGLPGITGKDGHTPIPGLDFRIPEDGKAGAPGQNGSPDLPLEIAAKLNTLEEEVEMSVIKGLKKKFETVQNNIQEAKKYGGGGGGSIDVYDEGVLQTTRTRSMNFTGSTVTVTSTAVGDVTIAIDVSAYLLAANNLSELTNTATARTNLGLVAGGSGDIWVEKAGDTMTGKLNIGGANALVVAGSTVSTVLSVQSDVFSAIDQQTFANSANLGAILYQARARGTAASPAVVQSGDTLAKWQVYGHDGTDYALGGYMEFVVDATPGNNDMPTSWGLYLTPDGSQSASAAVTIASTRISTWTSTMNVIPTTDLNALTLRAGGTSTAIKTFDIQDSSSNSWWYVRKRLLSDAENGWEALFTSSGSTGAFRNAFSVSVSAGFTGSAFTGVLNFENLMAGTNVSYTADATLYGYRLGGNRGIGGYARATTTGHNVGALCLAGNGAVNYGMWGASTTTKASAVNVGVFANAHNASLTSPAFIGLYATCYNTATVPPNMAGVKTALLADNQSFVADIALFRDNGTIVFNVCDFGLIISTQVANTTGAANFWTVTSAANTGRTASTEVVNLLYNLSAEQTWATGAITTQREVLFKYPSYSFVGSSTITTAATVAIEGAPLAGSNAIITRPLALWVQAGETMFDGGIALPYTAKTGTYTATTADYHIDCTANTFTVSLPNSGTANTKHLFVVTNSGAGTITVTTVGGTQIVGNDGVSTSATIAAGNSITLHSTGSGYRII